MAQGVKLLISKGEHLGSQFSALTLSFPRKDLGLSPQPCKISYSNTSLESRHPHGNMGGRDRNPKKLLSEAVNKKGETSHKARNDT